VNAVSEEIERERAGRKIEHSNPDWPVRKPVVQLVALTDLSLSGVFETHRYGRVRHRQRLVGQYPTFRLTASTAVPIPYFTLRNDCRDLGSASDSSCQVSSLQRTRSSAGRIAES